MANVAQTLQELGFDEWVLNGEPTNAEEFAAMFRKVIGATSNGTAILSDNSTDWPEDLTWDAVETKLKELNDAEPLKFLREERNRLIAETDWWASSDLTMTDAQKSYRQELRDITKEYSSLDDVKWPDKP